MESQGKLIEINSAEGYKHELKVKVLTMILHVLKSKHGTEEASQIASMVTMEEINIEWHKRNPNTKFKDFKCGRTLKLFLITECGMRESTKDEFEIVPAAISAMLQGMSDLPTQESDCDGKAESSIKKPKIKKEPETKVFEFE